MRSARSVGADRMRSFSRASAANILICLLWVLFGGIRPTTENARALSLSSTPAPTLISTVRAAQDRGSIAFVLGEPGDSQIYVINADGSGLRRLPNNGRSNSDPAWSPTGSVIAVVSPSANAQIYIINADGSGARLITGYYCMAPSWSPDGQFIAYAADENNGSIVVSNKDGSDKKYLVPDKAGRYPTWSPDGKSIAFASYGDSTMYIVDADGNNLRRIPNTTGEEFSPAWQPLIH